MKLSNHIQSPEAAHSFVGKAIMHVDDRFSAAITVRTGFPAMAIDAVSRLPA